MTEQTDYLLGHDDAALARLERQAQMLAPATGAILGLAGITKGMRVLDLGTGAGDVALLVTEMVGPEGSVVGVDRAGEALEWAAKRAAARGLPNVSFIEGDVHDVDVSGPFDAVVERLVLVYTPDPAAVLARCATMLASGGVMVAMEYEMNAAGSIPPLPLSSRGISWIIESFTRAGHDPALGARLDRVFDEAGMPGASMLGVQDYLPPDDEWAGEMVAGVIQALLPAIEQTGVATAGEVDIDTFATRLNAEISAADAIFKPPTLVGAWAHTGG
ncbi:MAG: class I SAM-dependent methyltransferase [Ilumatobacteraceae bacterium]